MRCIECYGDNARSTPINGVRDCLTKHRQYQCSKCGRFTCIDLKGEKRARCFFPFNSLETAVLYLKVAEIINKDLCGIYELTYKRGDARYKIFRTHTEFEHFLKTHPEIKCDKKEPVYISQNYQEIDKSQIKYLNKKEVEKYMTEMGKNLKLY